MLAPQSNDNEINKIDIFAMWISFACLAHCLLLPIIISILPFFPEQPNNDWVHKSLILIALPTSAFALWRSGGWQILSLTGLALFGLSMLGVAAFVVELHAFEAPLSVIGASVLAFVHFRNARLHQCKANNCAH